MSVNACLGGVKMKMIRCRQFILMGLIGFLLPFACAEKEAEEVVTPEQPLTDLPVAPAAPVAPEAPVSLEVEESVPKSAAPIKKKTKLKPGKKTSNKRLK
jgi:hypothetical protein